jgi:4-amino-4-deoxy-L-arabinose transferase-like glycosyltransferase
VTRPVLSLLILSVFTFCLGLGRQAITDSDEGYYAEASREMVESGDWLTPHFNYENRFEKPILYYWLTAATYLVSGTGEGPARFWSAMSGVGLVLITWALAGGHTRSPAAWLAGAIVATSPGCFTMARWALPDLPLTFFITLSILAVLRAVDDARPSASAWWALAGLGAALGFLTKGPVALVIPGVVLAPIWLRERRTIHLPLRGIAIAALVFAVVGLPWYVAMWSEHGQAYLRGFFLGDNVERFTTQRFNDARPVWYYVPVVLAGVLPWSVYLLTFVWRPLIAALRRTWMPSQTEWRLLLWSVMPLLFYTASIGKQPRYILPVLPPIAVLLAQAIAARVAASRTNDRQPGLRGATLTAASLFAALAFLFVRMQPLFLNTYPPLTLTAAAVAAATALALAWVAIASAWTRLPAVAATAAALLLIATQFGALAGRRPEPVEEVAAIVKSARTANEPIALFRVFTRNLGFYTGLRYVLPFDVEQAASFARTPTRVLLIASADDVKAIEAALGNPLITLGRVRYANSANFRLRTVLQPNPMDEVAEVLVVANK